MLEREANNTSGLFKSRTLAACYTLCNDYFDAPKVLASIPVALREHLRVEGREGKLRWFSIFARVCCTLSTPEWDRWIPQNLQEQVSAHQPRNQHGQI